jgi:hypothetical protein
MCHHLRLLRRSMWDQLPFPLSSEQTLAKTATNLSAQAPSCPEREAEEDRGPSAAARRDEMKRQRGPAHPGSISPIRGSRFGAFSQSAPPIQASTELALLRGGRLCDAKKATR